MADVVNEVVGLGQTPVYTAARKGHAEVVEMLVRAKADVYKVEDAAASRATCTGPTPPSKQRQSSPRR
jgi:hypothetical protein